MHVIGIREQPCRYFNSPKGCKWRGSCRFPHICEPLGLDLISRAGSPAEATLRLDRVIYQSALDGQGLEWHTAGYRCPNTNVYYYAEQGGGISSRSGVWWYTSQTDALDALADVMASCRLLRPR